MGVSADCEARIIPSSTTPEKVADGELNAVFTNPINCYPNVFLDQDLAREKAILWADIQSVVDRNSALWIVEGALDNNERACVSSIHRGDSEDI